MGRPVARGNSCSCTNAPTQGLTDGVQPSQVGWGPFVGSLSHQLKSNSELLMGATAASQSGSISCLGTVNDDLLY